MESAFVYTVVKLFADKYEGDGGSWGVGLGVSNLEGILAHESWSTLCAAGTNFNVESISGVAAIKFYIGKTLVAKLVGASLGVELGGGFNGWMDWS